MAQVERFSTPIPQDVSDALRVEGQCLTPSQLCRLGEVVQYAQDTLEDMYEGYIHPKSLERNKNLSERIVVLDQVADAFIATHSNVISENEELQPNTYFRGFADHKRGLVYVAHPDFIWEKDKMGRSFFLDLYESEEEAREAFFDTYLVQTTIHEGIHQYQDQGLGCEFTELGARFYEQAVLDSLELACVTDTTDAALIEGFCELQNEFGDSVHALSFGTLRDFPLRREIDKKAQSIAENIILAGNTDWLV